MTSLQTSLCQTVLNIPFAINFLKKSQKPLKALRKDAAEVVCSIFLNKYINQWLQLPWRLAQTCTAVSMCSAGRRLLAKLEFNRKLCVTLFMSEKAVSPSLIYCIKKSLWGEMPWKLSRLWRKGMILSVPRQEKWPWSDLILLSVTTIAGLKMTIYDSALKYPSENI